MNVFTVVANRNFVYHHVRHSELRSYGVVFKHLLFTTRYKYRTLNPFTEIDVTVISAK